jgi:Na+-transporting methylmalonyl-CoA/oxaloacetate decarboxylase gamma subunit
MKNSMKQQTGLTFIGLCFVLSFIAIVVVFVLRLFPLYNEKFQIEAAMNTVVSQPDSSKRTIAETRSAFMRALAVTNINRFDNKNIKDHVNIIKPAKSGEPPMLHVQYQATNKLFADIQLLLSFDRKLPLTNSSGSTGE